MPLGIGIGLSMTGGRIAGGGGASNAAPVLDWDDDTSDTTPDFYLDLTNPVLNDVITLQQSSTSNFASVTSFTNTLDQTELDTLTFDFDVTALSSGTYYFRAKHNSSAWSNTETVTIVSGGSPIGLLLTLTH